MSDREGETFFERVGEHLHLPHHHQDEEHDMTDTPIADTPPPADPASSGGYADPGGTPIPAGDAGQPESAPIDAPAAPDAPETAPAAPETAPGNVIEGNTVGTEAPTADPVVDPNVGAVFDNVVDAPAAEPVNVPLTDQTSPSPELPATTPDEVATDHPALAVDQAAPLAVAPDNPPTTATPPETADTTIDTAHSWDAGVTALDTGWITSAALPQAWTDALTEGHGTQGDYILIPAHLRDIEGAALAAATTVVGQFGPDDLFRVGLMVTEKSGDVMVELTVGRKAPATV